MINITPNSIDYPIEISEEEFDCFVKKIEGGWSQCDSHEELMAKLHYLRLGFHADKIDEDAFLEREKKENVIPFQNSFYVC